jgi:hypothetical protein
MNEQELFGLMAIAQGQQKAVDVALQKLGARQVELEALVAKPAKRLGALSWLLRTLRALSKRLLEARLSRASRRLWRASVSKPEQPWHKLSIRLQMRSGRSQSFVVDTDKRLHSTKIH